MEICNASKTFQFFIVITSRIFSKSEEKIDRIDRNWQNVKKQELHLMYLNAYFSLHILMIKPWSFFLKKICIWWYLNEIYIFKLFKEYNEKRKFETFLKILILYYHYKLNIFKICFLTKWNKMIPLRFKNNSSIQ